MSVESLFAPLQIKNLKLRNRFVLAPIGWTWRIDFSIRLA